MSDLKKNKASNSGQKLRSDLAIIRARREREKFRKREQGDSFSDYHLNKVFLIKKVNTALYYFLDIQHAVISTLLV